MSILTGLGGGGGCLDIISESCSEIPGRMSPGRFSTLGSMVGLKRKGHNYIGNLIRKHKVSVFRVHMLGPRIVVCDHVALRTIFRSECIRKVSSFVDNGCFIHI